MFSVKINLAKSLGVKPKKAFSYLVVKLGDSVKEGDLVALRKQFLSKKEVKAPCSARIVKYEEDSGVLVFEKTVKKQAVSVDKAREILKGDFGFGKRKGEIIWEENFVFPLSAALEGKILVTNIPVKPIILYRAASLGARGIICGVLDGEVKQELLKRQKTFQGFALLSCNFEKIKEKIKQGEKVLLDGEGKVLYET